MNSDLHLRTNPRVSRRSLIKTGALISAGSYMRPQIVSAAPSSSLSPALSVTSCVETAISQLLDQAAFSMNSFSASDLGKITSESGRQAVIQAILDASAIPSLDLSAPTDLQVGVLDDDPSISAGEIAAYAAELDSLIAINDTVVQVDYDSPTAGNFDTLAIVGPGCDLVFEGMLYFTQCPWPAVLGPDPTECGTESLAATAVAAAQGEVTASSDPVIMSNWILGECGRYICHATADCDMNGNIIGCTGTHTATVSCFARDGMGTVASETIVGNCCRVKCNFAHVSGFKSISVGADGFTLSITGTLGTGHSFSRTVKVCCTCA